MANKFWVGSSGTWDTSSNNWSSASGGPAGSQSAPGSGDVAIFDGASGGGTVTINGSTGITIQQITFGSFTGTLDNSVNNSNITLTAGGFSGTGTGTKTLNMGNGTWSMQGTNGNQWDFTVSSNTTLNCNNSTLVFTAASTGSRVFAVGSSFVYNAVSITDTSSAPASFTINNACTIATLTLNPPLNVLCQNGQVIKITNGFTWSGTAFDNAISIRTANSAQNATISSTANGTIAWGSIYRMTFQGGGTFTATNSFDLEGNSGITITGPSGGTTSGGPGVIIGS